MMRDCEWDDYCCDKCAFDFYVLVERFVEGIQHLELKVVYLRYLLSKYLPELDGEMLRDDIFRDLTGGFWAQPAYQKYLSAYHGGLDPLDSETHNDLMKKLARGQECVGL